MSATTSEQRTSKPTRGRWDWRAWGPACRCELDDLRRRALLAAPKGIELPRFIAWVEAEFAGQRRHGVTQQRNTLAKYRRFLYDLRVDAKPAHPVDVDVTQLECGFDSPHRDAHLNVTEPIAGPWDWRRNLPKCACELDSLRLRAIEAFSREPDLRINLGRFLPWVEGQAHGQSVGPSSTTLAKYRRFLWELNFDHEPVHGPDVDVEQLPCSFGGVAETAENPCSLGSVKLVAA